MYFCVLFIVCFVTFPVFFVCICVLNNCHWVATQLQLNILYQYVRRAVTCMLEAGIVLLKYLLSHRLEDPWFKSL